RPRQQRGTGGAGVSAVNVVQVEHLLEDLVELVVVEDRLPVFLDDLGPTVVHSDQAGIGERVVAAQAVGEGDLDVAHQHGPGGPLGHTHAVDGLLQRV